MKLKHYVDHCVEHNGITYRVAKSEDDLNQCAEFFFDYFLEGEPATKSKGGHKGVKDPEIRKHIMEVLSDGVSIMAVDRTNGHKLVGIRTSYTIDRSELPIKKLTEEELLSRFPPVYALLLDVFINTVWAPDVMAERPEIKRVYEMFAMATHPDYRSRGIARKLVAESWEVAKKAGCDVAMVAATHNHTKALFDKLGMEQISATTWTDKKFQGKSYFDSVVETKQMTGHMIYLK